MDIPVVIDAGAADAVAPVKSSAEFFAAKARRAEFTIQPARLCGGGTDTHQEQALGIRDVPVGGRRNWGDTNPRLGIVRAFKGRVA